MILGWEQIRPKCTYARARGRVCVCVRGVQVGREAMYLWGSVRKREQGKRATAAIPYETLWVA